MIDFTQHFATRLRRLVTPQLLGDFIGQVGAA